MKHPYPDHVVVAVSDAIENLYSDADTWEKMEAADDAVAEVALQALWDASRVEDIEQLENVPDFASLVDGEGFTYRAYELRNPKVFPVNIIHWGDSGA